MVNEESVRQYRKGAVAFLRPRMRWMLLTRILKAANSAPAQTDSVSTGRRGIYFAATGLQHSWRQMAESIGWSGYNLGLLASHEPRSLTISEAAEKYLGGNEIAAGLGLAYNSLGNAGLTKDLGWVASKTESELQQNIVEEVESVKDGSARQQDLE